MISAFRKAGCVRRFRSWLQQRARPVVGLMQIGHG
jgi:hypothetical protein